MGKKKVNKSNESMTTGMGLDISAKAYFTSLAVIFALMVFCYIITFFVPGGSFERDAVTGEIISGSFTNVEGGIPFWKWILSPFLVLGAEGSGTILAILAFLLIIGGVFEILGQSDILGYALKLISSKFMNKRYKLLVFTALFFMAMGSLVGTFEEVVPLVPIVTAIAISLGWDALTGIGMSLLAAGCGFAAGVFNPFSTGVAQTLSGLPMFSGAWLRAIAFVLIYLLLIGFLMYHARSVEKKAGKPAEVVDFTRDPKQGKALTWFAVILGIGLTLVLASGLITSLQDYTLIILPLMFLVGGIAAAIAVGFGGKKTFFTFLKGAKIMLPAVLTVLMASSIKYILTESHVMDSMLNGAIELAQVLPKWAVLLFIYLIVLIMNFFVASGSAKAFMMIPLIVPLAAQFGISAQLCIMAFAFGDGFSNALYATNPALLISLSLAKTGYTTWFRWSIKFQLMNLVLTSAVLMLGLWIGY